MLDVKAIADQWEKDEPLYKELGSYVSSFIKSEILAYEILPEVSFRTKELLSIVKKIKKKLTEKEYSYDHLSDKLGIRIICALKGDMDKVDDFIKDNFLVLKVEYKKDSIDFNKLDYQSNHYDATINKEAEHFKKFAHLKDFSFEIQVRTINQHAWSTVEHNLSYKQEVEIEPAIKRRVYRLLSLYEIADDEFAAVNGALINQPDNMLYAMLRKLESKTYKYAKVDYDRETSIHALRLLLSYFTLEQQKNIYLTINDFIQLNSDKINGIFEENRKRFFEIPFLTQPEIFFVWYGLEKFLFTIEDNWNNNFDPNELEQISTLWGKKIE